MVANPLNISTHESIRVVEVNTYGVGTFEKKLEIRGNSILSSVFIESISAGATLKINYYATSSSTPDHQRVLTKLELPYQHITRQWL